MSIFPRSNLHITDKYVAIVVNKIGFSLEISHLRVDLITTENTLDVDRAFNLPRHPRLLHSA